ncbi:hypothetical protein TELCIR_04505 [Teladorsagia circumcincta]|uniref:AP-3 complex subunit delta domain-containing protein n=1 Tax=Teladorsagia circumcincta TaxID=45464 RepID=A0A2G9UTG6_TELCI|nr:hypothetical protein TELCIR_04505 [Teladorsagia circumcincta]
MALRKVRSNLDRLFDKSLTDLIRGIRNNKENEGGSVWGNVEVARMKFNNSNMAQILLRDGCKGFISSALLLWDGGGRVKNREASYRAVDSAPSEANARYIASCIEEIKMELRQDSTYIKANAIEKLAYLQMLGYDISWAAFNVIEVMASTKYTEKRIGPTFQRLKDKLEDPDPGVQSAAVNVICELARKNPKNYLTLAPVFFKLMTTSSNNWMLIKIIKLEVKELSPEEIERRRKAREAERESNPYYVNRADGEMPEGAKTTDEEDIHAQGLSDEFRALDINLDEPLRPDEVVRGPQVYNRQSAAPRPALIPRSPTAASYQNRTPLDFSDVIKKKKKEKKGGEDGVRRKKKKRAPVAVGATKTEFDIDEWLKDEVPPTSQTHEEANNSGDPVKVEKKIKKKKKAASLREAYEEASGVCTPSNPNLDRGISPRMGPSGGIVSCRLCSNSDLRVFPGKRCTRETVRCHVTFTRQKERGRQRDYASSPSTGADEEIIVRLELIVVGSRQLKNIEANIVDTLNARMENDGSVAGKLDFKLPLRSTDSLVASAITK